MVRFLRIPVLLAAYFAAFSCASNRYLMSPEEFSWSIIDSVRHHHPEIEVKRVDSLTVFFEIENFNGVMDVEEDYAIYLRRPRKFPKFVGDALGQLADVDWENVPKQPLDTALLVPVFLSMEKIEYLAGDKPDESLVFEYAEGLYVVMVLYEDNSIRILYNKAADDLGIPREKMVEKFLPNIYTHPVQYTKTVSGGPQLRVITQGGILGASMLLDNETWDPELLLIDPHYMVFAVPTTEVMIFADRRNPESMAEMVERVKSYWVLDDDHLVGFKVSDRIYEIVNGKFVAYDYIPGNTE